NGRRSPSITGATQHKTYLPIPKPWIPRPRSNPIRTMPTPQRISLPPTTTTPKRKPPIAFPANSVLTIRNLLADLPNFSLATAAPPGYSPVRALLRILEEKGHVRPRRDGARFVYVPRTSPEVARRSALKRVVSTFFQGSVAQTMAALLETADTELSDTELTR